MQLSDLPQQRVIFLAELPRLLNSSLVTARVIDVALRKLCSELNCEAATAFLLTSSGTELRFWASQGGKSAELAGKKMLADQGIVGWVIKNKKSLHVRDVEKDERFFRTIDNETEFKTKEILCAPLIAQGEKLIGAVQALNPKDPGGFSELDQLFLDRVCDQTALAIFNAQLYHSTKRSSQALAELQRRKDDIISVISHEFRTPLNILQNSVELLGMGVLDEEMKTRVEETLLRGISRLTALIAKMRDVSGSGSRAEKLELQTQKVSLKELFEILRFEFNSICTEKRSLELHFEVKEGAEFALGDPTLLTVALMNLISNAIRFTPDGGKIIIKADTSAGLVRISVTDTGIGICESQHELIFEKFYEVTEVTNHSSGTFEFRSNGLGLGLSAVKNICDAHGSELEVESKLGAGSCFGFCLKKA